MNVLLLGNGFDLHHSLPTLYNDFLQTVNFITNHTITEKDTLGDIFGDFQLQDKSKHIQNCYVVHKESYDKIYVNMEEIGKIIELAQDNMWFSYLLKSVQEDTQWIDVEREIGVVLKMFNEFFDKGFSDFMIANAKCSEVCKYVINSFSFFYRQQEYSLNNMGIQKEIPPQYCVESPKGSGNFVVDHEKIVKVLFRELDDFSESLRLYLKCFVDNTLEYIRTEKTFKHFEAICSINKTITFNYTNTAESFYSHSSAIHLHGNVNDKIILGINPDANDMLENMDTTFLSFKKYYQRVCRETDGGYIKFIKELDKTKQEISLLIMGHSLDVTDKDIIVELFDKANEITILYHSNESRMAMIRNLIKIFGYDDFYRIRNNKDLSFKSTDSDFSEFRRIREEKQYEELVMRMELDAHNASCEKITVV